MAYKKNLYADQSVRFFHEIVPVPFSSSVAVIIALIWFAALVMPALSYAQEVIKGTPGIAAQRAVVNVEALARQEALAPPAPRVPKVMHAPLPGPRRTQNIVPPTPEARIQIGAPVATVLSPAPSSSFLALADDNTSIPPDTHGAAGPNHLMTTLNTQVRIQNRAGATLSTVTRWFLVESRCSECF